MKRFDLLVALACGASVIACSTILGLQEPTVDPTIGADAATTDAQTSDAGGDGGTSLQLVDGRVRRIALDDTTVFYSEPLDLIVGRVEKDGSNPLTLASGGPTGIGPDHVAVDATDVFWLSGGGIHQCAKTGCANSPIHVIVDNSSSPYSPSSIAIDATTIYFSDWDSNASASAIRKVPKGAAGGTVTTVVAPAALAPCTTINDMILAAGYLYFTCDEGPVGRVPVSGSPVEILTSATTPPSAMHLVVGGATVYYTQFNQVASIFAVDAIADAGANAIAVSQAFPFAIDLDPQYLYWTNIGSSLDMAKGSIARCQLSQCGNSIVTIQTPIVQPTDVRNDQNAVYWAAYGNGNIGPAGVWRMAKP